MRKTDGAEYQIVFFLLVEMFLLHLYRLIYLFVFLLAVFKLLSIFSVMLPVRT